VLAAVIVVLAWPIANEPAKASLDESWKIALHLAAGMRLQHGVDIVFTYGPLGFLASPHPYVDGTSALALIASIAIYLALIGTMLVEARRILPLWAALVVTLLVARFFVYLEPFEAFQALFAVWCTEALSDRVRLPVTTQATIGGILAGAAVLSKFNVGIFVVLMGLVTVIAISRPAWKGLTVFIGAAAASGVGLWLALGQGLTELGAYASAIFQIVAGYNEAIGEDIPSSRTWIYLALAGAAGILAWCAWQSSRHWPGRRRIDLAILGLVVGFAMWKTVVVRDHATYVLATGAILMFAFAPNIERGTWLVGVLAISIGLAGSSAIPPSLYLNVVGSTRAFIGEVADSFVPSRSDRAADRTREQLRARYQVEPSTLTAIGGHTVHVDPHQTSVVFAYPSLHWAPLPIFQSYSVFTPRLDMMNADRLRSAAAPERILRDFQPAADTDALRSRIGRELRDGETLPTTVDGHFRWFEAPAATLETFCRYEQIAATDAWQVLARTDRSCGPPEPLATVSARPGEPVAIPVETRPDRFVIVRVHGPEPSLPGRIGSALLKAPDWYVTLDDTRYRFVPPTAQDGLLVAVPPSADGTGPFAFGDPIRTIAITQGLEGGRSEGTVTYEFLSVPLIEP
jgi:hypothetical protein